MIMSNVSQLEYEDSFDIHITDTPDNIDINIGGMSHNIQGNSSDTSIKIKTFPCAKSSICIPYSSANEIFNQFHTNTIDFQLDNFEKTFNIEWYKQDEIFLSNGQTIKLLHGFLNENFNEPITIKQDTPTSQVNVYFLHNLFVPLSTLLNSQYNTNNSDIYNLKIWYNYIRNIFIKYKDIEELYKLILNYEKDILDKTG